LIVGDNSDWADGLREEMLEFREEVYKNAKASGNAEACKLAMCLMHALFGASFGYRPCCILEFVKNTYSNTIPPKALSKVDERAMCPDCQVEESV
jgi:hypothetical protein